MLIEPVVHVSLEEFKSNLIHSVNKFNDYIKNNNIKKYYIVIGANKLWGSLMLYVQYHLIKKLKSLLKNILKNL